MQDDKIKYMSEILNWYISNKDYIDLAKDVVFAIGAVATVAGFLQFIKFIPQRKVLNKRQEMDNDARLYSEVHSKLKVYVESYDAKPDNLRDIGIRLLYIKNYPYNLDNDGFRQELYYYFLTEAHKPSGYISGKGIYVLENVWFWDCSVYFNPKNGKWFIDKKGCVFKKFVELKHKQVLKRIPFANIYGYDFDSDWADKGEPVFYTKFKYTDWKLFADNLEAITLEKGRYPLDRVTLKKGKRARRVITFLHGLRSRIRGYIIDKKIEKQIRKQQLKGMAK